MAEYAESFNDLVDAHNAKDVDIEWLKSKVADQEDRSRRNNLKIRNVSEAISSKTIWNLMSSIYLKLYYQI